MHAVPDDVNPESLEMLFGRVWEAAVQWTRDQLERNERRTVFFIDDLETLSIESSNEKDCIEYLSNFRSTLLSAVVYAINILILFCVKLYNTHLMDTFPQRAHQHSSWDLIQLMILKTRLRIAV